MTPCSKISKKKAMKLTIKLWRKIAKRGLNLDGKADAYAKLCAKHSIIPSSSCSSCFLCDKYHTHYNEYIHTSLQVIHPCGDCPLYENGYGCDSSSKGKSIHGAWHEVALFRPEDSQELKDTGSTMLKLLKEVSA